LDVYALSRKREWLSLGCWGLRPGGFVENRNQRVIVSADGQIDNVEQLALAKLVMRSGQALRLRDIATITEGTAPSISAANVNGKPGVFLMVQGQLGANTFETTLRIE
jgi:multidrug efflux pump subunit AcrB